MFNFGETMRVYLLHPHLLLRVQKSTYRNTHCLQNPHQHICVQDIWTPHIHTNRPTNTHSSISKKPAESGWTGWLIVWGSGSQESRREQTRFGPSLLFPSPNILSRFSTSTIQHLHIYTACSIQLCQHSAFKNN